MSRLAIVCAAMVLSPLAYANVSQALAAARTKWDSLGVGNYSFVYSGAGSNIVPYQCIPYSMRSTVKNGRPRLSTLLDGHGQCDIGGRPPKYWHWPRTVEELFAAVERLASFDPEEVRLAVEFDLVTGIPVHMRAEMLQITDSDEGFDITEMKIKR